MWFLSQVIVSPLRCSLTYWFWGLKVCCVTNCHYSELLHNLLVVLDSWSNRNTQHNLGLHTGSSTLNSCISKGAGMALHTILSLKTHASVQPVRANEDSLHLLRAVELAGYSSGLVAPHPNFGCVIARGPRIVGEGTLYAQGTKSAELQAVEFAGEHARGATAYLNLEPGDCHGDDSAINALTQVIIYDCCSRGLRAPLI